MENLCSILPQGVEINGKVTDPFAEILTMEALSFVRDITRELSKERLKLLKYRKTRQKEIMNGKSPCFLLNTQHIRTSDWKVSSPPKDLEDRRVEIVGSVDRKMIVKGMTSGAKVFIADFEDTTAPTWQNIMNGQINLRDAVNQTISYKNSVGKVRSLNGEVATLIVRPRGLHLEEKNVFVDGYPVPASIFDLCLFLYHNAIQLIAKGSGPYYSLPKIENYLEARLWNKIFLKTQRLLGMQVGTIKATAVIETISATFEMDEILYELREHSVGLNCAKWNYLFSYIKLFQNDSQSLPTKGLLSSFEMPLIRAYSLLAVKTCHRRGTHCIGTITEYIPVDEDSKLNEQVIEQIRSENFKQVVDGFDGACIPHPDLVSVTLDIYNDVLPSRNQIEKQLDIDISVSQLLDVSRGKMDENSLRKNISIIIQYIESWLRGYGFVLINNLLVNTGVVEFLRVQVWHWLRQQVEGRQNGRKEFQILFIGLLEEEVVKVKKLLSKNELKCRKFDEACQLLTQIMDKETLEEFFTIPGYKLLS